MKALRPDVEIARRALALPPEHYRIWTFLTFWFSDTKNVFPPSYMEMSCMTDGSVHDAAKIEDELRDRGLIPFAPLRDVPRTPLRLVASRDLPQ